MKAKEFTLKVVNEIEKGKFEIKEFNPHMSYESFIENIISEAEILKPTGLKDKNDNEIYEGDIVEVGDFIYSIKFEIGSFMLVRSSDKIDMYSEFDKCWNDDVYPLCQFHWESNAEKDYLYNCKIIGNIYENPELLNSK